MEVHIFMMSFFSSEDDAVGFILRLHFIQNTIPLSVCAYLSGPEMEPLAGSYR